MKPTIIEIIGPPGVGKSTIYRSLCKNRKPGSPWVYPDLLLAPQPRFISFKKWLLYHLRMLLGKKLTKSIPVDYGLRFAGQHRELAEFCWELISDSQINGQKDIGKRFRSAHFLFATFCLYQAIAERPAVTPCIIEEGLLQKSFFITDDEYRGPPMHELLNEYVRLLPLPYAIIYIDTPAVDEIVKRLRGRGKIIASHFDKSDEDLKRDTEKWQYVYNNILARLKNEGVLIIRIDGNRPVKKNVSRIMELLKNMDDVPEAGSITAGIRKPTERHINFTSKFY